VIFGHVGEEEDLKTKLMQSESHVQTRTATIFDNFTPVRLITVYVYVYEASSNNSDLDAHQEYDTLR
jgi:hypothetical protein